MHTTPATPAVTPMCPPPSSPAEAPRPIFPPADADAATYRQWIAASPWPEVVFAAAGAR